MERINVTDEHGTLVGWFDKDKAEKFDEDRNWNGSNWISVATGSQWHHEVLYRTAGGRWVVESWSQYGDSITQYRFVSDDEAREWLLANNHDKAVEQHFGEIEEERGPGRPEIGPTIQIRLPETLLAKIDLVSEEAGVSRAETIRRLLATSLNVF